MITETVTARQFAKWLYGVQYGDELLKDETALAKENGLVIVYGYSDDCMEFEGAICGEIGCFNGGTAYVTKSQVSSEPNSGTQVKAIWHDKGNPCWTYETKIPHETFDIYEDDKLFCTGIVFSIRDIKN